jgi:hypothetical protein
MINSKWMQFRHHQIDIALSTPHPSYPLPTDLQGEGWEDEEERA